MKYSDNKRRDRFVLVWSRIKEEGKRVSCNDGLQRDLKHRSKITYSTDGMEEKSMPMPT